MEHFKKIFGKACSWIKSLFRDKKRVRLMVRRYIHIRSIRDSSKTWCGIPSKDTDFIGVNEALIDSHNTCRRYICKQCFEKIVSRLNAGRIRDGEEFIIE